MYFIKYIRHLNLLIMYHEIENGVYFIVTKLKRKSKDQQIRKKES